MFSAYIRRAIENDKVIFPNRFCETEKEMKDAEANGKDLRSLEDLQGQKGPYQFGCQYLNDPVDDDSIEFKRTWFRHFTMDEELLKELQKAPCVMSVDPAFKLKETHDDTGIVISKTIESGIYILEAIRAKLSPEQLIDKIFHLTEIYQPYKVKIEVVAAQILLTDLLRKEMRVRKQVFMIDEYHPGTTNTKTVRIRKLIPYYANGQILHRPGLIDLEEQLVQFPRGRRDDIVDALAAQVGDWNPKAPRVQQKIKEGTYAWWKKKVKRAPRSIDDIFKDLVRR